MEEFTKGYEGFNDPIETVLFKDPKNQFSTGFQIIENAFRQLNRQYDEHITRLNAELEELKAKYCSSQTLLKKQDSELKDMHANFQKARDEAVKLRKVNNSLKQRCEKLDAVRKSILANLADCRNDELDSHNIYPEVNYASSSSLDHVSSFKTPMSPSTAKPEEVELRTRELFKLARSVMEHTDFQAFLQIIKGMNESKVCVDTALLRAKEILVPAYAEVYNEFESCVKLRDALCKAG